MAELVNSFQIHGYTYEIAASIIKTHNVDPVMVSTQINQADVSFAKKISPVAIDHGETANLQYSIKNNSTEDITAATINDSLLNTVGLVPTVLNGGILTDDGLQVEMNQPIKPNQSKNINITLKALEGIQPSMTAYTTMSTGNFTFGTDFPTVIVKTSSATFSINCAELQIFKVADAQDGQILEGNALNYTITIMNTGNVDAVIPVGGLIDNWSANYFLNPTIKAITLDDISLDLKILKIKQAGFSNVAAITIPGQKILIIRLSGNVAIPK